MPSVAGLAAGPPQPACISSFGQAVHVFASKQRPIKISIYGNDFRCARSKSGVQQQAWHMRIPQLRGLGTCFAGQRNMSRLGGGPDVCLLLLNSQVCAQAVWLQLLGVRFMLLLVLKSL